MTRILLVDDEPLITDSLSYSLKREGFEVKAVGDGEQAMKEIGDFDPDLVVLDIMLPGMNGLEVCRRIRANTSSAARARPSTRSPCSCSCSSRNSSRAGRACARQA